MPQRDGRMPGRQRVSILTKEVTSNLPKVRNTDKEWRAGDKVRHKVWGVGTVREVMGAGAGMQLKIAFPTKGVRQVVAQYAPLEKM